MNHLPRMGRKIVLGVVAAAVVLVGGAGFSQEIVGKRDARERMKETVEYLAAESMDGRGIETRGLDKAAERIAKRFGELGLKPGLSKGSYFQTFSVRAKKNPDCLHFSFVDAASSLTVEALAALVAGHGSTTRKRSAEFPLRLLDRKADVKNIVAILEGEGAKADELLVIGAHYDHLGVSEKTPGRRIVYPGANDNASGVAVMLETARILAERPAKLHRRIAFVAFSGEESGLVGSFYYVNHPPFPLRKTIAMLNLDMVGQLGNRPIAVFGTGTSPILAETAEKTFVDHRLSLNKIPFAWAGSDHMAFYANRIPVAFFHTAGGFEHYHRPSDTPETLDYAGMTPIAQSTADLAVALAEMDRPPRFAENGVFAKVVQMLVRWWGRFAEKLKIFDVDVANVPS